MGVTLEGAIEKRTYKKWELSEFANYQPEGVLKKFYPQIEKIKIHGDHPKKQMHMLKC